MSLDHYVTLGRSGLRVSPFCLGAMTFGDDWGWGSTVPDAEAILTRYIEQGGNFLDTANAYTKGHSEKIIGDYVHQRGLRRDNLVIATKFFANLFPPDPNAGGASRKSVTAACNESLRRLQTDYIDLYWMHLWDRFTPIEETLRALDDLVAAGKVCYIGFSDTPAWKVAQAQVTASFRGWTPLVALQIEYSLIERTVEGELIPMAQELGLGVTPWSPLRGGVLTGKYTRENVKDAKPGRGERVTAYLDERTFGIIDELVRIAGEVDTTPAAVALAWVQTKPEVDSTIIGARTMEQLEQNLAGLAVTLDDRQVEALDQVSTPTLSFPLPFLQMATTIMHAGSTVDGEPSEVWPMAPQSDDERY
ncbi:MAG: aldo/keto reductase [Acidobacteria bacterium]|jgi:aryl-alcohol dehydrogenase-like predicted oxidoreductase|nr:aldo/keto reductase [Acidobacteriota bacterium]MDP7480587.1 aldo/keto reductase [Vicinamibacterales bacterium]MDP7692543.1 aldo/keto reductase [Vicinamibacterales bacterium]HJN42912.1 aldo/keto reductase [Vicinamibacterales bacterium]